MCTVARDMRMNMCMQVLADGLGLRAEDVQRVLDNGAMASPMVHVHVHVRVRVHVRVPVLAHVLAHVHLHVRR